MAARSIWGNAISRRRHKHLAHRSTHYVSIFYFCSLLKQTCPVVLSDKPVCPDPAPPIVPAQEEGQHPPNRDLSELKSLFSQFFFTKSLVQISEFTSPAPGPTPSLGRGLHRSKNPLQKDSESTEPHLHPHRSPGAPVPTDKHCSPYTLPSKPHGLGNGAGGQPSPPLRPSPRSLLQEARTRGSVTELISEYLGSEERT